MRWRLLMIAACAVVLAGCATTHITSQADMTARDAAYDTVIELNALAGMASNVTVPSPAVFLIWSPSFGHEN
jgi:hypothetical protein